LLVGASAAAAAAAAAVCVSLFLINNRREFRHSPENIVDLINKRRGVHSALDAAG
jgi:hypothetical protein